MNRSLAIKLGAIALLILLLLIPLLMIGGVISDRQQLRDGVLEDIARSSSYSQQLSGPLLVVPYRKTVRIWKLNATTNERYQEASEESGRLYFLPERFCAPAPSPGPTPARPGHPPGPRGSSSRSRWHSWPHALSRSFMAS